MNKTWNEKIAFLLKGFIYAVIWFQAIAALVWGFANIASIQPFEQARNYLSVDECLRTAGYDSVGYAYFISACRVLQRITRIPYFAVAYIFQFIICNSFIHKGCAAILRALKGKKVSGGRVAMVTVFIITNPFLWQMIFALLPDALAFSLTLYGIGNAFLYAKNIGKEKSFPFAFATVFALFVLLYLQRFSFYVCLGCIFVFAVAGLIKLLIKKEMRKGEYLIRNLIYIVIVAAFAALALFVVISDTEWFSVAGADKTTLKKSFSGVFSPFVLARREYPFGDNANALYLNIMWQKRPLLTYFYVSAARVGFAACIPCLFLKGLMERIGEKQIKTPGIIRTSLFFGSIILATALYGAFVSPAEFDFRFFFIPYALWAVWGTSIYGIMDNKEETTGEEK